MRSTLLLLPLGAAALPAGRPKLSADSLAVFAANPGYPQIPDALEALCRSLAANKRPSPMDNHYRTKELARLFRGGKLAAFCGEIVPTRMNMRGSC